MPDETTTTTPDPGTAEALNGPQEPRTPLPRRETRDSARSRVSGPGSPQDEAPAADATLTAEEGAALMGAPEQLGGSAQAAAEDDGPALAERFAADVAKHEMTVLVDQPGYRHLYFAAPGPNAWLHWFEIVTWPGSIAINGDMESFAANDGRRTFMHARTDDMFEFFRGKQVSPEYWSSKVSGGAGVSEFSQDVFRDEVLEYAKECSSDYPGLIEAVREQIFDESICCPDRAFVLLEEFDHEDFYFYDFTERDFTKFSTHYLWCLHAIVWAIAQYDAARAAEPEFFQPSRTYTRPHHGETITFVVEAVSTSPDGRTTVAHGWRTTPYTGGGWEPTTADDFTGWTEATEGATA